MTGNYWRRICPRVESLEDRTVPASITVAGSRVDILGDVGVNRVTVRDNGNGDLGISVTGMPGASLQASNIRQVRITTFDSRDAVRYFQTGARTRSMALKVSLGQGADIFIATTQGAINTGRSLTMSVQGGPGADALTAWTNSDVLAAGLLSIRVLGDDDPDRIDVSFQGKIDGTAAATVDGGPGDDVLQVTGGTPAESRGTAVLAILGNAGNDLLTLLTVNTAPRGGIAFTGVTSVDGGDGFDTCVASRGTIVLNCEVVTRV